MPIRMTIKGSKRAAQRAAKRRGIPTRCEGTRRRDESFCEAPCSAQMKVYRWYGEPSTLKPGRGLPPGTLLFFRSKCDDLRGRKR